MDLSTGSSGNKNVAFRAMSLPRTDIQGLEGQPVLFDVLICYDEFYSTFTDHCDGTPKESVQLERPFEIDHGDHNALDVPVEDIERLPEYRTAQQILQSAELLQTAGS